MRSAPPAPRSKRYTIASCARRPPNGDGCRASMSRAALNSCPPDRWCWCARSNSSSSTDSRQATGHCARASCSMQCARTTPTTGRTTRARCGAPPFPDWRGGAVPMSRTPSTSRVWHCACSTKRNHCTASVLPIARCSSSPRSCTTSVSTSAQGTPTPRRVPRRARRAPRVRARRSAVPRRARASSPARRSQGQ